MVPKINIASFKTDLGELILGSYEEELCLCDWRYRKMRKVIDERIKQYFGAEFLLSGSEVIEKTKTQLTEYFYGQRKVFDLPLKLAGTEFQKRVWESLMKIEYGQTKSYSSLSEELGDLKAIRAVASANGANAISIIIPCHRIIGKDGSLVGYAGGLSAKKKLLALENKDIGTQLSLF